MSSNMISAVRDAARTPDPSELVSLAHAREAAEIMQALASPSRVRILDRLRRSPCSVGELAAAVGVEQNAISNHLRLLRHLALVTGERHGRHVIYALHDDHVAHLLGQVLDHVAHLDDPAALARQAHTAPPAASTARGEHRQRERTSRTRAAPRAEQQDA